MYDSSYVFRTQTSADSNDSSAENRTNSAHPLANIDSMSSPLRCARYSALAGVTHLSASLDSKYDLKSHANPPETFQSHSYLGETMCVTAEENFGTVSDFASSFSSAAKMHNHLPSLALYRLEISGSWSR